MWKLYFTIMNHPKSKAVDKFVNDLLDLEPEVISQDEYYIRLQLKDTRVDIWVANRWYAYASSGRLLDESGLRVRYLWSNLRPSRKTMSRLVKYTQGYILDINEIFKEKK